MTRRQGGGHGKGQIAALRGREGACSRELPAAGKVNAGSDGSCDANQMASRGVMGRVRQYNGCKMGAVGLSTRWLIGVALLGWLPGGVAAPLLDGSGIRESTLSNGLKLIVKSDPAWDLVAVNFCVRAGPLYEAANQQGLSDLVRYMMYDAPVNGGRSVRESVEDLGADFDATTTPDSTQIRCVMSAQALPVLFPRLAKATMAPEFSERVWLQKLPELRRRLMDLQRSPTARLFGLLWETSFRQHPYGRPVSGSPDALAGYTTQSFVDFHKNYYAPGNVSLIVAGGVQYQAMAELAEKELGSYAARPFKLPTVAPEPEQTDYRTRLEKAPVRGTLLAYAWRAAGMANKRDVCTMDVIYALLGEGQNARLMRALAKDDKLSAVPEVQFITKRDPGLFIVTCVCPQEREYEARDVVLAEIGKLRAEKLSAADLAAAKDVVLSGYAFDASTLSGQVGCLAFYEAIDTWRFAVDYPGEVQKVTAEDVQRVAQTYLDPAKYTLVIIRPQSGGDASKEARLTP